jgi:hypothetical protein
MTDDELKALVASLAIAQRETDRQMAKTDRQIKELSKQIGGLGNKFGSFTEGMAFPSMQKILREKFKMEIIAPNFQVKKNGENLELDVFAYSNGEQDEAVIVEVKSHVKEYHIDQLLNQLQRLRDFVPKHETTKIYGILAGVVIPESLQSKIINAGLYLAQVHDDQFTLKVPQDFVAKAF